MIVIDAVGLSKLYNDLKRAGDDLRKDLRKGVGAAVKPIAAEVRSNARSADLVKASKSVRVTQRYGSQGAVVRVQVLRKTAPYAADGSVFKHPVFGNRKTWVTQPTRHEFWDRAVDSAQPAVLANISKIAEEVMRRRNL